MNKYKKKANLLPGRPVLASWPGQDVRTGGRLKNPRPFIIISKNIITNEMIFSILMKFFKKCQLIIATHNIDITSDIDSNIIINTPITANDIEFNY